ncbi:D-alanyl-D-alanine carboxypeptidase [Candidatus Parcubacteria bacterium]|jgi:serine-type D-Ala-D-Ala endopeptidase (penicillin-binding protein 7)|nr:D-alanyl-D-alanine carboxypeptidase [Candidatus Parcubacteria bacterium]
MINLWAVISILVASLGLSSSPSFHLPTITITETDSGTQAVLSDKILSADTVAVPFKINNNSMGVKITAEAAAVMDKATGTILWQKNSEEVRSLASITKLMTVMVFLENNPGWNTQVTMDIKDEANGGSPDILRGEVVTVKNLFYTALISSDNNSANALVRSTGIGKEKFLDLMNKKADALGLVNTHFVDVTGLSDYNVSTALEIIDLAQVAFAQEDIREATTHRTYSFQAISGKLHKIHSTNYLLGSYLDISAGKTGHINSAGYCLVAEIDGHDGIEIISVVLGSDTNADRFQDLKALSTWVFENFAWH